MPLEGSLRRSAALLALAGGIEYGLQLLVPMILVRSLDETAFGQYRLLWLMAATAFAIAPAFMPQSLFYFLARAGRGQKRLIIGNVLVYLIAAGCVVGAVTSGWNPWLQQAARNLFFQTHGLSALFLALSVVSAILDVLPTADGRAPWQANATIGVALLRALLLSIAALTMADIAAIALAMVMVAVTRLLVLAWYIRKHADGKLTWQMTSLKKQLAYALPFAVGTALFLLRTQADQWVVISMLPPAMYATFSIGAVVLPIATLIRQPVYNAMMPLLNSAHARGDSTEAARLIAKSNGITALLLVPVVGGMLATAPELVEIVYTSRYRQAAPIMQVYLIGMMMNAFAVGHVLPALNKGRFAAVNSAGCLIVSVILSIIGVIHWGLIGAAFGSVLTLAISELLSLRVVARTLGRGVHQMLDWGALWPTLLGTCVAISGVSGLSSGIHANVFVMLLFKGMIYAALFVPCFILAGGLRHLGLLMRQYR
jgi:O-antigen/teichoic acid export membrane protein